MSETPKAEAPAAAKSGKSSLMPMLVGAFLTALLSGGAAFGGAKYAGAHATAPPPKAEHEASHEGPRPPGPTLALEPFLVNVMDAGGKTHAMKVTIAVEFEKAAKEEEFKILVPRLRDAALGFFRGLTFEQAQKPDEIEKAKSQLLERIRAAGAEESRKILVTDLVVQ